MSAKEVEVFKPDARAEKEPVRDHGSGTGNASEMDIKSQ